jgi:prolycopene isomerase
VRGRYEFEISLHELSDVGTPGNPGGLRRYFDRLGITKRVEFVQAHNLYRSVAPGLDITMPKGREAYTDRLCTEFPSEAVGIKRFIERAYQSFDEVRALGELESSGVAQVIPKLAAMPFRLKAMPRYLFHTWDEVIDRDIRDPRCKAVLSQYWGYFGLPPSKVSFFYFAIALASYMEFGASHIKGRSQALSEAFVDAFREMGGETRFNCGAKAILAKSGAVTGVETSDGEKIGAKIVISNADPVTTCTGLIGKENVPADFMRMLGTMDVAASSINVYMGVARPWERFKAPDHEVFIGRNLDMDAHYEAMKSVTAPGGIVATLYNAVWPDISPPGTSMIVLTALAYGRPWADLPPSQYFEKKHEVGDAIIDLGERVYSGLRKYAEVVEVATPLTNMRYTGTLGGSIYGFNNTPMNHTVFRLKARGPIQGLYFAGAWAQPGGGYSPCIMSGRMAAGTALKDLSADGR